MNPNWQLKVATEADIEATVAQLTDHMNEEQRAVFRDKLKRYVRKPDRDLIVAVQGKQIIGFVCVIDQAQFPSSLPSQTVERLHDYAFGTQLFVHPRMRRGGIGSSLHLRAEQWAKDRRRAGYWFVTHLKAYWYERDFGYEALDRLVLKDSEKVVMAKKLV